MWFRRYLDTDELIDKLLEHLWLNHRLNQNTPQSYHRDLEKVAARLRQGGKSWFDTAAEDLVAAIYVPEEKASSQAQALSACKRLYTWLEKTGKRADNPTRFLTSPHREQSLPDLITEAQIEKLPAAPNVDTPHGLRDKALLGVMYVTGLRVIEAVKLKMLDLDLNKGWINITDKGDKQRYVPLGGEAVYWIERYYAESRPLLLKNKICDELFVGQKKSGISRQLAWMIVKEYADAAGIRSPSPHGLRHAFATHLVNHGADLCVVQVLPDHADISTTQIYTYVTNQCLKELVGKYHPRSWSYFRRYST